MKKIFALAILLLVLLMVASVALKAEASSPLIDKQSNTNSFCIITDSNFNFGTQTINFNDEYELDEIRLLLRKRNTTTMPDLDIYFTKNESNILYNVHVDDASVQTTASYINLVFSPIHVDTSDHYKIWVFVDGVAMGNHYNWLYQTGNPWPNGIGDCYVAGSGSTVGDYAFELYGEKTPDFNHSWIRALIPIAFATTTCEFITTGATTTASCSDASFNASINNPTQDIAWGLTFALGTLIFIASYFKPW